MSRLGQKSVFEFILLFLCFVGTVLVCQDRPEKPQECFSIRVHLNGKLISPPKTIQVKTKAGETTLLQTEGCFKVPQSLVHGKEADVFMDVAKNRIQLFSIATGFFSGRWDITLEDRRFARTVDLPKNAEVREACYVVFHGGEPANAIVQTNCRKSIPKRNPH